MAKQLDYRQMAIDIVKLVGGSSNVQTLSHCMTRLRFVLKDLDKADQEAIKKIDGVLGVVYSGGQLMVILGKNLLNVFDAVQKEFNLTTGQESNENPDAGKKKEPLTVKSACGAALGYVQASVTPMVPGLVAGGMLKVFLLLATLVNSGFADTTTYTILSGVADSPFYFMPIFVAYGAATKLGSTTVYAMIAAASLLHGNWTGLVASGESITLVGLPVRAITYSSSLLPALLLALCAYYMEKFFNKIVPGIFKSLLVGLGTVFTTGILGFVILAPLGNYAGQYLALVFVFLGDNVGFIAVGILAACLPWLVMTGMHVPVSLFMTQSLVDPGYDSLFRPAFLLHNMSEGGACLGAALRMKNPEKRSEALGIAFGCIFAGVTEPAIYGINLPRKKPMFGVMAGGAVGGVVASLLGARAYTMGYSTIMALPIFEDTVSAAAIAVVVAVITAAVVTFILCPEISREDDIVEEITSTNIPVISSSADEDDRYVAVANGNMIPLETVHDETFASKALGDGVAFEIEDGTVAAPCSGTLSVLADTGHAFGISRPDGVEVLVHVGIDTVKMEGKGFINLVKVGSEVKAGTPVLKADLELIKKNGYEVTTMLIITDDNGKNIAFKPSGAVHRGDVISQ